MTRAVEILDAAYDGREWIAGDDVSVADLLMGPIVHGVGMFPEGKAALDNCANLTRAFDAIEKRDSYQKATPPPS